MAGEGGNYGEEDVDQIGRQGILITEEMDFVAGEPILGLPRGLLKIDNLTPEDTIELKKLFDNAVSLETANPKHYVNPDDDIIEAIDDIRGIGFNLGSARKYMTRLGLKGGGNTEERDAKSAIWYCYDLMTSLIAKDGEIIMMPSVVSMHEFDCAELVKMITQSADKRENDLELRFANNARKRFVLASIHMLIAQEKDIFLTGLSEEDHAALELEILAICTIIIYWIKLTVPSLKPLNMVDIYKGSKSTFMTDDIYSTVEAIQGTFVSNGLVRAIYDEYWGDDLMDEPLLEEASEVDGRLYRA